MLDAGCWVVGGPYVEWVPVDFLSDAVVARYGRFDAPPERVKLEKIFFLDDEDKRRIDRHRVRGRGWVSRCSW